MTDQAKTAWIAVDWGTTNLRIWALDSRGEPIARRSSTKGMSGLEPQEFEAVLVELVGDLLHADTRMPVIICGMAGSRQGWAEAPYRTVPCAPPSFADATRFDARDGRLDISILPGVKQRGPGRRDARRGNPDRGVSNARARAYRHLVPAGDPHQVGGAEGRTNRAFQNLHDRRAFCAPVGTIGAASRPWRYRAG